MKRSELLDLSRDDLTNLLSDVLLVTLMRGAEENDKRIPDGMLVQTETKNLNIMFDINVKYEMKKSGIKAFKAFLDKKGFHICKPGDAK